MKNKKLTSGIIVSILLIVISLLLIKPIINKINYGLDLKGGFEVLYLVESLDGKEVTNSDITSTYKSIRNRIDTLGVSEPEISLEGNKIRVKLPGVTDEEEARKRLSTPAVLTFRNSQNEELMTSSVLDSPGAKLDYNSKREPVVALSIKDNDTFYRVTKSISESTDQLIVIWLDYEENDTFNQNECGKSNTKCISAATVPEGFANNVIIEGSFTEKEAKELVDLINSGSLPTKLTEISTKTVDASFGANTLTNVGIAGIITFIIIALIMIFFYRISGLISSICLLFYAVLVFIVFNSIDGVLTLTGIAALILGIGMAVDSSVITLEKIKEELSQGKKLKTAYLDGNKRSLVSLIDANITTLIAAIVLFIFGESSVKGFATMLIITILMTVVAMILLNRYIMNKLILSTHFDNKETLLLGKIKKTKIRENITVTKIYIITLLITLLLGLIFSLTKGFNLGIDFKGGSTLLIKSEEKIKESEINKIINNYNVVEKENISEFEIYYKLEEKLKENEIKELKEELNEYNYKTDISVISNIVKKDLTKNAIKALIIASLCVLIYVTIRFTKNFAIASIIAILSDVLITISVFLILNIEINFIFIAGILTIIGYSINDTIVVFDIIREKMKELKDQNNLDSLKQIVKESISLSLKRNIITSVTTLTAIIVLLIMNMSGIKEFNITVLIGLTSGTFSSLLLAPNLWLLLEKNRIKHPKKETKDDNELEEKLIKGINS